MLGISKTLIYSTFNTHHLTQLMACYHKPLQPFMNGFVKDEGKIITHRDFIFIAQINMKSFFLYNFTFKVLAEVFSFTFAVMSFGIVMFQALFGNPHIYIRCR